MCSGPAAGSGPRSPDSPPDVVSCPGSASSAKRWGSRSSARQTPPYRHLGARRHAETSAPGLVARSGSRVRVVGRAARRSTNSASAALRRLDRDRPRRGRSRPPGSGGRPPRGGPGTPGPLVAVAVGAAQGRRWWPLERFASLIDAVGDTGVTVVLLGSPDEAERGRSSVERLAGGTPTIDLIGPHPAEARPWPSSTGAPSSSGTTRDSGTWPPPWGRPQS